MKKAIPVFISALLAFACATEKKEKASASNSRFELLPDPEGKVKDHEVTAFQKENQSVAQYAGIYHFGDSEGESELHLHFSKGIWSAQRQWGQFSEDGKAWIPEYTNFTNIIVDIEGNFSATETLKDGTRIVRIGKYIGYTEGSGQESAGLEIDPTWSYGYGEETAEIGYKIDVELNEMYAGDYPESTYRVLDKMNLKQRNTQELKVMRNEIYARYGLKFQSDGAMFKHFEKQKWYRPIFENVDAFLNPIEKENIKLIQTLEGEK